MLNIKVEGKQRGIATHNRMNHPHTSHPANCLIDKSQSGPYIFFYILLLKKITWTYGGKKYQYWVLCGGIFFYYFFIFIFLSKFYYYIQGFTQMLLPYCFFPGSGLNDGQWHAIRLVAKENFAMLTIDGEEVSAVRSVSPLSITTGGTYHLGGKGQPSTNTTFLMRTRHPLLPTSFISITFLYSVGVCTPSHAPYVWGGVLHVYFSCFTTRI